MLLGLGAGVSQVSRCSQSMDFTPVLLSLLLPSFNHIAGCGRAPLFDEKRISALQLSNCAFYLGSVEGYV